MTTQKCKGAVCYIDLLGFSYLTNLLDRNDVFIGNKEKKSFGEKKVRDLTLKDIGGLEQYICERDTENKISVADRAYKIVDENLKKFHQIIEKQCVLFPNSEYSVISDSLFIIAESSDDILFLLANIFRDCIKSGILLRAGLAYGPYYYVKTHVSGFNVYGSTVTKAVNYERKGKGCRIFTDLNFPNSCKSFSEINSQIFYPYKNYYDYSVLDCFEWLMLKDKYVLNPSDILNLKSFRNLDNVKEAIDLLYDNIEVYCNLCFSPKYEWNTENDEGLVQLGASIEYLSSLMDRIYGVQCEEIENGIRYGKDNERSEQSVKDIVQLKKEDLKEIFKLKDKEDN